MFPTDAPYAVYFDKAGAPLDNGYIYFGVENQNPETSPLQVYWDLAGTQPVAQPVRTIAGFPVRLGSIADIYSNAAYSQTVRDSKGNLVRYSPSSTAQNPFGGTIGFALAQTVTSSTQYGPSFEFRRNAEYAGGDPTKVNSALHAVTFVDNTAATSLEWAFLAELHNTATAGQNVAAYAQGNKGAGAGPTFAAVFEEIDLGTGNPASGSVTTEFDVRGNGTDASNNRIGIDVVVSRPNFAGTAMEAGYAVRIGSAGDTQATIKTGIGFAVGTKVNIGFDISPATLTGAAIKLANTQAIQFDTSVLESNTDNGLDHNYGGVLQNRLLKTGGLQVHSVKVVGDRATGWVVDTGTASRASHATYSDTAGAAYSQAQIQALMTAVTNVTQAVKAVKDDLFTHGLIGT